MKITPIDPKKVTKYGRSTRRLEEFALFCIFVAGKDSHRMAKALAAVLEDAHEYAGLTTFAPFRALRHYRSEKAIHDLLEWHRVGTYKLKGGAIHALIHSDINLKTCTREELTAIPGIGLKTASFFIVHSRPDQRYAVLDRHVLRYMGMRLGIEVPADTPSDPTKYRELEEKYLEMMGAGEVLADFDLEIYRSLPRARERPASILRFW